MQNTIDKVAGADNSDVAVTTNGDTLPNDEVESSAAANTAGATTPSDVEQELNEMESAVDALQRDSLISAADADSQKGEVARTRKMFREMSPDDRAKIVSRRRELGRQILTRQLAGASVVESMVKLNHTRLKPLFEQWWPFMNRMTINLTRFGH
uniref:hypothetical protein n=1 Tax=Salmonella enterica TaxID=28901 RepID=UPI00398C4EF0